MRLQFVLPHTRGLDLAQSLLDLGFGLLQGRIASTHLILGLRLRILGFLRLALQIQQMQLHRFQLRGCCTMLLCCLLAPSDGFAFEVLVALFCGLYRAARGGDATGSCLQGSATSTRERCCRHLLHGATQLAADAFHRRCQTILVLVEPFLPCPHHLHQPLISQTCVLHPHQGLLASKGLLELLPVLLPDGLAAHRALLPSRLERVALVPQNDMQCLVCEWQLCTTRHLLPVGQRTEHLRGTVSQLVRQRSADGVLHCLPSSPHVQDLVVVDGCDELPQELHEGVATQRLPVDRLGVGEASCDHLGAELLHPRLEVWCERRKRQAIQRLELWLHCGAR
mmetsp:Transcript_1038/g.2272  ORF Transcript_1038/g.2272 Transcript_1038/m.2272 type:complete len:338 (-) Transcript_1038:520-1533(-)